MIVFEFLAILTALFMEGYTLQTGSIKGFTSWLTMKKDAGLVKTRLFLCFLLWVGSILYLVYAVAWCFSPVYPVQIAGIVLMVLSGICLGVRLSGHEKPMWFAQLDSTISMVCILLVAMARIKGF